LVLSVLTFTAENSGSISAEHGLGLMKAPYIRYSRDETAIELMKKIKTMFDPKGLLNPGKYII
jgi:FAD/FMN-containing dehydrogenase